MSLQDTRPAGKRRARAVRVLWGTLAALSLALGAGLVLLGVSTYSAAHLAHPVEIDGQIADYKEIIIQGGYARNELSLAGDAHVYVLDRRQFHPTLPQRLYQDARIRVWVDRGTTQVIAVTLYDLLGVNAATYTTDAYDDPTSPITQAERQGYITGGAGGAILVIVLLWLAAASIRGRSARARPRLAPPAAPPMAYPQPPAAMPALTARRPGAPRGTPAFGAPASALEELPTQPTPSMPSTASADYGQPWPPFQGTHSGPAPAPSASPTWLPAGDDVGDLPTRPTPSAPRDPNRPG